MPIASTDERQPRFQRRKEARSEEIVAAALELFVEQGFSATKMDDVATRAGVTKGTVYLYFDSKEALFRAVVHQSLIPALEYAERRLDAFQGSARDLLVEMLRGWWKTIGESRYAGIPKLIVAEAGNFPELAQFYVDEVLGRGRGVFARILKRGIGSGEFRPLDVDTTLRLALAPIQYASIYTHSLLPYDRERFDARAYLESHIEIFLRGILAEGSAPATGAPTSPDPEPLSTEAA